MDGGRWWWAGCWVELQELVGRFWRRTVGLSADTPPFRDTAAKEWGTQGVSTPQGAWVGRWIGAPWSTVRDGAEVDGSRPLPIFRRTFRTTGKVAKAELRIAGLGQFEARLDGQVVGQSGLHEAWTDYSKTVRYESYDVTGTLWPSRHVLAVLLGNGMYNVQRSLMPDGKARYTKFEGKLRRTEGDC